MAFISTSTVVLSTILLFLSYKVINLARYVRQAKRTGLPYVVTPLLETEAVAFALTPILRLAYDKHLERGLGWPRWCRFIIKDWSWEDRRRAHDELGDVFLCVSPEGIICYTADAAMGWDVMNRRHDFTKPRDKYKILEPYGPNVATAEGANYRFHVRITAPPFGDSSGVNDLVWEETVRQTQGLLARWAAEPGQNLEMAVNRLTLAVISRAGFGKTVKPPGDKLQENKATEQSGAEAGEDDDAPPPGYRISFLRAIHGTTANMVPILMLPGWLLGLSPLRQAHIAHSQLGRYLTEMIKTERKALRTNQDHQNKTARGNLLTAVMRASFAEGSGGKTGAARKEAFSDDEVMGNLFIYLLAGYETTANAISYALACMALHPDVQDACVREIDALAYDADAGMTYSRHFDKLPYLYGFMYEVLRLYPGVTLITKVAEKPQRVTVGADGQLATSHLLPAGTRVYLSAPAVHYHPRYWPDPERLDPRRWIQDEDGGGREENNKGGGGGASAAQKADATRHMRGTLLTFSDGARACLGRRFAQAEFMAFFATLLREYKVRLAEGVDPVGLKRDLDLKSAGKLTLAPPYTPSLVLERRVKG